MSETNEAISQNLKQTPNEIASVLTSLAPRNDGVDCEITTPTPRNDDTTELESKIDSLVYQLYDLTQDEINIIES